MASTNLKRCDSICYKIVTVLLVCIGFLSAILRFTVSPEVIGYMLVGTLVLMSIIRTILFCYMDIKGGFKIVLVTKIKEYREQAGYKQSELAELVGTRRETIVHLENGRYNPSLKLAMSIAKVFHVTVEDLFEFVDEEK